MYQVDGFDHCLIGVTELWGIDGFVLVLRRGTNY
jgi:hypothetical protein